MKKHRLLQEFNRNTAVKSLEPDAVRLYMLLLANCPETGSGKILRSTIRKALGNSLSTDALKAACLSLEQMRLIEFYSLPPKQILIYRLLFSE